LFLHGGVDGVSLNYLSKSSNGTFLSIEALVNSVPEISDNALNNIDNAQNFYSKIVNEKKEITNTRWNAELQLVSLLYVITKSKKLEVIIETGVANGLTTNAIMHALTISNSSCALHSFDVLPETKKAYTGEGNWNFHLLNRKKAHKQIVKTVMQLPKVDLWVHDSNHGYRWQKFEYQLAFSRLKKGGILISDDIDASPAWGELAKTLFRESYVVFDSRKFIGIAFK
jgi:hypothetical protein